MKHISILQKHPYHLVDPSPWPFFASLGALMSTIGGVMYMHNYIGGNELLLQGFIMILIIMSVWWRDVIREAFFEQQHTKIVQHGLRIGMLLFITSEIMFFFAFFWSFFHASLAPSIEIGSVWPPRGIEVLNPWKLPLLNTILLLTSGATVTISHHMIISGKCKHGAFACLFLTIIFASLFTIIQALEYQHATFTISDSVYGSTFFLATGFHGFHVLIGTLFLSVCLFRLTKNHFLFNRHQHLGFESAIWYWHFVDVVWLFLFVSIYWWGGN